MQDVLDMLDREAREDEEDIADAVAQLKDAKVHGTVSWDKYKQELNVTNYSSSRCCEVQLTSPQPQVKTCGYQS